MKMEVGEFRLKIYSTLMRLELSTVNHKPPKITATKGKKSVVVIISAEKGKTVTSVCCISAARVYFHHS